MGSAAFSELLTCFVVTAPFYLLALPGLPPCRPCISSKGPKGSLSPGRVSLAVEGCCVERVRVVYMNVEPAHWLWVICVLRCIRVPG